ncbi:hypothetical protein BGX21_009508 [Mortierella sp. AD011]|nr:hypothetical protein BGX20_005203 [Mortierella sp. AD010]KAF9402593.1 hypothetical protein BGX21_009508 [Mortierella sp. AD011]
MDVSKHQPQASLIPDAFRIVEARFRILEELLSSWLFKLEITGMAVSNKKITTQAFEVHRMLSGLLREPLPPCLFTSGWLKGFKKRRNISPVAMKEECKSENTTSQPNLQTYAEEDTYICDMTIRQSEGVFETEGYSDIMLDPSADDASKTSIENWLNNFAMNDKERKILLLVDTTLWELLSIGLGKTLHQWNNKILLHKLQEPRNGMPSIGARIMKEFKANYHTLLVEKWAKNKPRNAEYMADTEPHLKFIPKAWQSVHQETIKSCFRGLHSSPSLSHAGHQTNAVQSARTHVETKLSQVLKSAFPTVPDTVLQYYLIQDKDTGPSSFLRTQISELQKNCDFEMFFRTRCTRPR